MAMTHKMEDPMLRAIGRGLAKPVNSVRTAAQTAAGQIERLARNRRNKPLFLLVRCWARLLVAAVLIFGFNTLKPPPGLAHPWLFWANQGARLTLALMLLAEGIWKANRDWRRK